MLFKAKSISRQTHLCTKLVQWHIYLYSKLKKEATENKEQVNSRQQQLKGLLCLVISSYVLRFTLRAQQPDQQSSGRAHRHRPTSRPSETPRNCDSRTCTGHRQENKTLKNHSAFLIQHNLRNKPTVLLLYLCEKLWISLTVMHSAENPERQSSSDAEDPSSVSH